jgi:CrcB protein
MEKRWKLAAAVAIGGAVGAVARSLSDAAINSPQPMATFIVNMAGSFILGTLTGYAMKKTVSDVWKMAIGTGFCGGLTTMSALSKETVQLASAGHVIESFSYVSLSVVFGTVLCWAGLMMGSGRWKRRGEKA